MGCAMNSPAMTTKGEQAKKQLIAAALAQFGEYGMNATTRDIAARAGQNIAAITYYFGSKEDLYLACAQWIADFIGEQFRPHAEEAERLFAQPQPDRAAIRELILRACRNMIQLLTQMIPSTSASLSPVSSSLPRRPTIWCMNR